MRADNKSGCGIIIEAVIEERFLIENGILNHSHPIGLLYRRTACVREAAERRLRYSGLRPAGHSPEDSTGTLPAAVPATSRAGIYDAVIILKSKMRCQGNKEP